MSILSAYEGKKVGLKVGLNANKARKRNIVEMFGRVWKNRKLRRGGEVSFQTNRQSL